MSHYIFIITQIRYIRRSVDYKIKKKEKSTQMENKWLAYDNNISNP